MSEIARQRLHHQRLLDEKFTTPAEVVAWLGAVQAQEYAHAKWALALRLNGFTDADMERAFTAGEILRTHIMRPTWHFVTPDDIRWLLAITGPRVHALNAYMQRQLELDDTLLARSGDIMAKALQGGKFLMRKELGTVLSDAGIVADGMRLGYIVHYAELEAVLCSGPRRGKQFTYALLEERAPNAQTLSRDEALAELTKRYFTAHGPALIKDFAWWASMTAADIKEGLEMVKGDIISEEIGGKTYYFSPSTPAKLDPSPTALLLPPYDEFGMYKDHSASLDPAFAAQADTALLAGVIAIDGQGIGYWRREFDKKTAIVELLPFRPLSAAEMDAISNAAQRFGEFLGMPVELR